MKPNQTFFGGLCRLYSSAHSLASIWSFTSWKQIVGNSKILILSQPGNVFLCQFGPCNVLPRSCWSLWPSRWSWRSWTTSSSGSIPASRRGQTTCGLSSPRKIICTNCKNWQTPHKENITNYLALINLPCAGDGRVPDKSVKVELGRRVNMGAKTFPSSDVLQLCVTCDEALVL